MKTPLKLSYAPPRLTAYGRIEELTRTGCFTTSAGSKQLAHSGDDHWINEKLKKYGIPIQIDDCS